MIYCIELDIYSAARGTENLAAPTALGISINGEQHTFAKRGLSIVVYDKDTATAVDAVTFDTHSKKYPAIRAEKECKKILSQLSELHTGFGYAIA